MPYHTRYCSYCKSIIGSYWYPSDTGVSTYGTCSNCASRGMEGCEEAGNMIGNFIRWLFCC